MPENRNRLQNMSSSSQEQDAVLDSEQQIAEQSVQENPYESFVMSYQKSRKENSHTFTVRIILVVLLCLCLTLTVLWLDVHLENGIVQRSLIGRMQNVAMQAAQAEADLFERECSTLQSIALSVQSDSKEELQYAVKTAGSMYGANAGLISVTGLQVAGKYIEPYKYRELSLSMSGNTNVGYYNDLGLLFTAPILIKGNVRYVLYRFINKNILPQLLPILYQGDGAVFISNEQGLIVNSVNLTEDREQLFKSPSFLEHFLVLKQMLNKHASASIMVKDEMNKDGILFSAQIPGTNLYLTGLIPKTELSPSFISIRGYIFALILLIVLTSLYLMHRSAIAYKEKDDALAVEKLKVLALEIRSETIESVVKGAEPKVQEILQAAHSLVEHHDPQSLENARQNVEETANNLQNTLHSLMQLNGRQENFQLDEKEYDLRQLLISRIKFVNRKCRTAGLRLDLSINPNLPRKVFGDETRVSEVITHILDNAVKFTKDGGVALKVGGDIKEDILKLRVIVIDTGRGMEDVVRLGVFHELPAKDLLNSNRTVRGFGLSICYNLLKIMGGYIDVQTVLNKGSTITICVPQRIMSDDKIGKITLVRKKKVDPAKTDNAAQSAEKTASSKEIADPKKNSNNVVQEASDSTSSKFSEDVSDTSEIAQSNEEESIQAKDTVQKVLPQTSEQKPLQILDADKGIDNYDNDLQRYLQACDLFCHISGDRRYKLNEAFAAANWKYYAMLMCSLKNSSRQLGSEKLYYLASQLESAARIVGSSRSDYQKIKPQGMNFISERHASFIEIYDELVKTIHSSLNV